MRKQFIYILFLIGAIFSGSDLYAQTVSGVISDINGPLPGVNIIVKGTTKGAATDFDGNYLIEIDNSNSQ